MSRSSNGVRVRYEPFVIRAICTSTVRPAYRHSTIQRCPTGTAAGSVRRPPLIAVLSGSIPRTAISAAEAPRVKSAK